MLPIDFQVTYSKIKVKPLFWAHCVVRSISFDPFIWSISNLMQGLPSVSRWSLLIFRSHVQRSRSNHSSEPSVLSTLYIVIPCLLALDRFCFYREDKPEFVTTGGIYVSETFLVYYIVNFTFLRMNNLVHKIFLNEDIMYLSHLNMTFMWPFFVAQLNQCLIFVFWSFDVWHQSVHLTVCKMHIFLTTLLPNHT